MMDENVNELKDLIVDFIGAYQKEKEITNNEIKDIELKLKNIGKEKKLSKVNEDNANSLTEIRKLQTRFDEYEQLQIAEKEKLDKTIEELKNENEGIRKEFSVLATRDDLQKEFNNAIRSRVFYYLKSNTSYEYILFSRVYFDACRKHVYSLFGVGKYTRIAIEDFDMSLKAISKWYPTQKLRDKEIQRLIGLKDKNALKSTQENALNIYLLRTQGGTLNNAI